MTVLVTGAGGFLGGHVVRSLPGRGHDVRAMIRSGGADLEQLDRVEIARGDLRDGESLRELLAGVDAVVHLAAAVGGDADAQFATTVGGTERLLAAMAAGSVRRLVLASSIVVYDWERATSPLTESSATVEDVSALDRRGGYAIAKAWQERVARRAAERDGIRLTVLRPGFVWAAGREPFAGVGPRLGGFQTVIGPTRPLPLTYVENCADCFATALESPLAVGETFNVVDDEHVTAWRFMGEARRYSRASGRRLPIPYVLGSRTARLARRTSRAAFGEDARLPTILTPAHFEARFKPVTVSADKAGSVLGWRAPWSLQAALRRTYGTRAADSQDSAG
jgi:nucleoside-diphosphate-sugar epimerase